MLNLIKLLSHIYWDDYLVLLFYFNIMNPELGIQPFFSQISQIHSRSSLFLLGLTNFSLTSASGVILCFSVQSPESRVCCFDLFYFILSFFYYCFLERGFAVLIIQPFWKTFSTINSYYSLFDYLISVLNFPLL